MSTVRRVVDVLDIQTAAVGVITQQLRSITQASDADLQTFAAQIVTDAAEAAAENDPSVLAQLLDQAHVLAEINRVRAVENADAMFATVLNAVLTLLVNALLKAI